LHFFERRILFRLCLNLFVLFVLHLERVAPHSLIPILNFGFSCIVVCLLDPSLSNQFLENILAGGESDGFLISATRANNFLVHFISILKFLILLLHEILQILSDDVVGPLMLPFNCPLQLVFVRMIVSNLMVEMATLILTHTASDEVGTVARGSIVCLQLDMLMMRQISNCCDGEGGIFFVAVSDKGLDMAALIVVGAVFGRDDDFFHCTVASEIAIARNDLTKIISTSGVFSSFIMTLASTNEYSIMRRSLCSLSRREFH